MWPSAPGGSPGGAPDFRNVVAPVAPPSPPPAAIELSALESFRFAFRQPDLLSNVLFGLLLQFIPLVGPIVRMGWSAETTRRLVFGDARPIPKFSFNDFSKYLERGVVPFVAQLVVVFVLVIPLVLLGVLAGIMSGALAHQHTELGLVIGIAATVLGIPAFALYFLFMHSTLLIAELTGDFRLSFSLALHKAYLARCWGKVLVRGLVFGLLTIGVSLVGILACGIGLYLAIQVVLFASGHLRYQLYNAYRLEGGEAFPTKSPTPTEDEQRELAARYYAGYAQPGYGPGYGSAPQGYGSPPANNSPPQGPAQP
ncbi:MAG TPA: DUF4013 domain-containing protein [Polyangiaceae bacterium]|nr:DUF4013 domain-containing protein [Polyangiaceae bacterium]